MSNALNQDRSVDWRVLAKSLLLFLAVTLTFFVAFPWVILQSSNGFLTFYIGAYWLFGLLPVALGLALVFWTLLSFAFIGKGTPAPFDPPKKLVVAGPFRYVRNPMYLGAVMVVAGEAVVYQSGTVFLQAIAMWVLFHVYVVYFEEPVLKKRFGQEYADYLRVVPRWLPRKGV